MAGQAEVTRLELVLHRQDRLLRLVEVGLHRADFALEVFGLDLGTRQRFLVLIEHGLQVFNVLTCPIDLELGIDRFLDILTNLVEGRLDVARCRGAEHQEQRPSTQRRSQHTLLDHRADHVEVLLFSQNP